MWAGECVFWEERCVNLNTQQQKCHFPPAQMSAWRTGIREHLRGHRCGSCGSLRGCATMQVHILIHSHIADRVSQPLSTMGSSETVNKPPLPLKTSQKLQRAQRGMPTPDPDLLLPLACLADHNSKFSAFRHYSGHVTPCMSPLSTMLVSARTSLTSSPS